MAHVPTVYVTEVLLRVQMACVKDLHRVVLFPMVLVRMQRRVRIRLHHEPTVCVRVRHSVLTTLVQEIPRSDQTTSVRVTHLKGQIISVRVQRLSVPAVLARTQLTAVIPAEQLTEQEERFVDKEQNNHLAERPSICHSGSSGRGASTVIRSFETGWMKSTRRDISEMLPSGFERGAPYFRSPLMGQPIAAS